MSEKIVLDSYALLAYLKRENRGERVKEILTLKDAVLFMNEINLGECFYILARERGQDQAEYFIQTVLPNLPLHRRANTFQDIIEAARIKSLHSLSYADCFAVHTARKEAASLITGDPEFKKVAKLIKIEWL